MITDFFAADPILFDVLAHAAGPQHAETALSRAHAMGPVAAGEVDRLARVVDRHGPRLERYDEQGRYQGKVVHHPAYRELEKLSYGEGIIGSVYREGQPHATSFGMGYLFAQSERGLYCPICMTDGAARVLSRFASPEIRDWYVPRMATPDLDRLHRGAMFLTERQGGSDVGATETVARWGNDGIRLHGEKWFCSNVDAEVILALARPEGAEPGTRGLGLYLIPSTLPGGEPNRYHIRRLKKKLGARSMATGEVELEGALSYQIGGPGQGFSQMAEMLNLSRLYNAVTAVACTRRALTESVVHARSRRTFGRLLTQNPMVRETLADMAVEWEAGLRFAFDLIRRMDRIDQGRGTPEDQALLRLGTPLIKMHTGKRAVRLASEAVEMLGGNGYIEDFPTAMLLRDAQVLPIWEGTTNILSLDSLRAVAKDGAGQPFLNFLQQASQHPSAPAAAAEALWVVAAELSRALGTFATDASVGESHARRFAHRAAAAYEAALLVIHAAEAGGDRDRASLVAERYCSLAFTGEGGILDRSRPCSPQEYESVVDEAVLG